MHMSKPQTFGKTMIIWKNKMPVFSYILEFILWFKYFGHTTKEQK